MPAGVQNLVTNTSHPTMPQTPTSTITKCKARGSNMLIFHNILSLSNCKIASFAHCRLPRPRGGSNEYLALVQMDLKRRMRSETRIFSRRNRSGNLIRLTVRKVEGSYGFGNGQTSLNIDTRRRNSLRIRGDVSEAVASTGRNHYARRNVSLEQGMPVGYYVRFPSTFTISGQHRLEIYRNK